MGLRNAMVFSSFRTCRWVDRLTERDMGRRRPGATLYSNAGDKRWQMVQLSDTQRIQTAISERAAAIC
jgi:hypothetical protein